MMVHSLGPSDAMRTIIWLHGFSELTLPILRNARPRGCFPPISFFLFSFLQLTASIPKTREHSMRQQYDNKKMTRDGFVFVLAASVFVFASPQPSAAFSSVRFHSVGSVRPTGAPSIRRRGKMTNVYMGDEDAPAWNRRKMLSIATYVALSQPWPESACAASQPPAHMGDIVLLIGATSVLGQRACEQLLKRGYSVRGLTRRQADVKKAVAGTRLADVEWVEGNLNQISDFAPGIIKGVKKIIFAPILASRAGMVC